ncbi:MAG: Aspartate/glutamate/uridylate kinase [Candidatus Moranbacteria bacterium GW2011_GWF2_34_56]|nr:MAG: Aspartate/glutamate/uridylate kinase [Candidatus Moranbacteria bacterium GW2011_GWF1_34_10]KKP64623.1 MAG: Aspartate/glutamate/uridylate kinase [Candidatus Moranbacteria bacterium GW2011_GWF2_34_56]
MNEEIVIVSLGGSLIFPEKINAQFIIKFKEAIEEEIAKGYRFVIITGGGRIARTYIQAAEEMGCIDNEEKDWLGVHATRMNAHFIKTVFKEYAHPRINKNPRTKEDLSAHFANDEKIMVAAGWRPGWSTDYVATILAERFKAKKLINLSNITYLCDKDPNKFSDAKKIEEISWIDFRKMVGDSWDPGMSAPFDPIASKLAQENNLEVAIIGGDNLDNMKNCIEGEKFEGSLIK